MSETDVPFSERIEALRARRAEIEHTLGQPGAWDDQDQTAQLGRELAEISEQIALWDTLADLRQGLAEAEQLAADGSDLELAELAREESSRLSVALKAAEAQWRALMMPADRRENHDVIMEVRAGTGGDEAALFAADLLRMYSRFAERQGWRYEVLELAENQIGGVREGILSVKGRGTFHQLRHESGVHRVQRVPETEAQGRIHTSTATVAVLAEPGEVEIVIRPEELRIESHRASGAGGQHVNKTDSAIRIVHLPTGMVVTCQDERSQHKNRDKAMRVLRARLFEQASSAQQEATASTRKSQVGTGDRSERIRTYNFPQGRVTDHRIGLTLYHLAEVLDGDLTELIDSLNRFEEEAAVQ
ncbi:MAG: peptide chain release factor 1 [Sulfobacillus sp.]